MMISGSTRLLGIFGDPVAHSRSPEMHNAALAAAGLDYAYVPFHVPPERLPAAVTALRTLGIRGISVTIPHKEAILDHLDAVAEEALLIGAVNTVVNDDGRLTGHNTDGTGLLRSLAEDLGFATKGRRILLLGAGGACRAAVASLAGAGAAWLGVANRDRARAAQLTEAFAGHFKGTTFAHFALDNEALGSVLPTIDLLVNTSAVGLHGETFSFDPTAAMTPPAVVLDMVYRAGGTPLLDSAGRRGLGFADGRGMLAGQGEEAFALWTGCRPPSGVMRSVLFLDSCGN